MTEQIQQSWHGNGARGAVGITGGLILAAICIVRRVGICSIQIARATGYQKLATAHVGERWRMMWFVVKNKYRPGCKKHLSHDGRVTLRTCNRVDVQLVGVTPSLPLERSGWCEKCLMQALKEKQEVEVAS